MSRRVLAALAAATLMLGTAACGNEGEGPVTTPPPPVANGPSDGGGSSQEPSDGGGDETEEPEVAAPDVPAPDPADYPGMDEETPEGAEQAARYFAAIMIWGFQTGEVSEFEGLFRESCEVCQDNADSIRKFEEAKEYWSPTSLQDIDLSSEPPNEKYQAIVGYSAVTSEHTEPDLAKGTRTSAPELHLSFGVGLNWLDGQWIVDGLALDIENA